MSIAFPHPELNHLVVLPNGDTVSRKSAERWKGVGLTVVSHPGGSEAVRRKLHGTVGSQQIAKTELVEKATFTADENRLVAKGVTRAFGIALRQLPEAACRPAAAAKLASLETFTADQVSATDFTIQPQLDRARTILRGLPVETAQAGDAPAGYCRTRRSVEVKMAMLPQTAEGHRLRHKLGRVLLSVDEGRSIVSALTAAGFDPAAYQA